MLFEYFVEFGTPYKNKVVFENGALHCKYGEAVYATENLFLVTNIHSEITLCFSLDGNYLVGAQSGALDLELLPKAEIAIPDYMDGKLRAESMEDVYLSYCEYLDFVSEAVSYDRQSRRVAFGDPSKAQMTVRVCENLYVSLDGCGRLTSIVIQLY